MNDQAGVRASMIRGAVAVLVGGVVGYFVGSPHDGDEAGPEKSESPGAAVTSSALPKPQLQSPSPRGRKLKALLLVGSDPMRALASLESELASGDARQTHYQEIYSSFFSAWAMQDSDGAIAALEDIKYGPLRTAIHGVLRVVFEQDPTKAGEVLVRWQHRLTGYQLSSLKVNPLQSCQLLPRMRGSSFGSDLHQSLPGLWAEKDPLAALTWAQSQPGRHGRSAIDSVVSSWAKSDLEGAIKAYESGQCNDPRIRKKMENEIAVAYGKESPAEAVEWLSENVNDRDRTDAIVKIVGQWADDDVEAAVAWAHGQKTSHSRHAALVGIGLKWMDSDVAGAADYLSTADSQVQWAMARRVGYKYIVADPVAALDWVDQLVGPLRSQTETQMIGQLVKQDMELAVAEFNSRIERLSMPAVERFSAEYFEKDAAKAKTWLESLPPGIAYERARYGLDVAAHEGGGDELRELAKELTRKP